MLDEALAEYRPLGRTVWVRMSERKRTELGTGNPEP